MNDKPEVTKVQELIYELRIEDAMTRDLVTIDGDMSMLELREVLRSKRISGAPVMEGQTMVGIVSIEDLIKWLAEGGIDCPVRERMTVSVASLYADEPLVHAASKLEESGLGRFPVLDRNSESPIGVITKGDIIESVLRKLEIEYHAEEIHRYRASHIFEDVVADKVTLCIESILKGGDFSRAGWAASGLKKAMTRLGVPPKIVRRAAIASYEAEMNVIIYADEGTLTASVDCERIRIDIKDKGAGIADIERALQPGYSTASNWVRELGFGAGMGLVNIKKCADVMNLTSTVGEGTHLSLTINMGEPLFHSKEGSQT